MTACAGTVCPQPPICIFELPGYSIQGPVAAAAAAAAANPIPGSQQRTVHVTGSVKPRGGVHVVQCDAPPSGLTTEDATGIQLPPAALATKIRVALLGYLARSGEPTTLLNDMPTFSYFDAAVKTALPRGGPPNGGTVVTIQGRNLVTSYVSPTQYFPEGGSRFLDTKVSASHLPCRVISCATSCATSCAVSCAVSSAVLRHLAPPVDLRFPFLRAYPIDVSPCHARRSIQAKCVFSSSPPPPYWASAQVHAAFLQSRVSTAEASFVPGVGLRCTTPRLTVELTSGILPLFIEVRCWHKIAFHPVLSTSREGDGERARKGGSERSRGRKTLAALQYSSRLAAHTSTLTLPCDALAGEPQWLR